MMEAEDYTFAEMADINFFYGRANGNARGKTSVSRNISESSTSMQLNIFVHSATSVGKRHIHSRN
jgi:hypothetical protein